MSYLVLARKFRPQVFEDVLGQPHVTQTLQNALKSGRVAHAYLFSGPRGVGKTSVARILAKCLNCQEGPASVPCNHCASCREITQGSSLDVLEIDGASNRGIDDIRELRENIKYLPVQGRSKVYIVDEVHMLTGEAFNALLKTLEEPPNHAVFIMATTELNKVPLTIRSRCQSFHFRRIAPEIITGHLVRLVEAEQVPFQEGALRLIARQAEGSLRDSLSLLDQILSFSPPEINVPLIQDVLGMVGKEALQELVRSILAGDLKRVVDGVGEIYESGYDLKYFYRDLVDYFRGLLLVRLGAEPATLLTFSAEELREMPTVSSTVSLEFLQDGLQFLIQSEAELHRTGQPRLALEVLLMRLTRLKEVISIDDLLERLDQVHRQWPEAGPGDVPVPAEAAVAPLKFKEEQPAYAAAEKNEPPDPDPVIVPGPSELDPEPGAPEPPGGDLEALLGYIRREALPLASFLEKGRVRRVDHETLEWDFGENAFYLGLMESNGNREKLEKLCRDFLGRRIRLRLSGQAKAPAADKKSPPRSGPSPKKRALVKETLENPQVKEILNLFQGEVVEVKVPE